MPNDGVVLSEHGVGANARLHVNNEPGVKYVVGAGSSLTLPLKRREPLCKHTGTRPSPHFQIGYWMGCEAADTLSMPTYFVGVGPGAGEMPRKRSKSRSRHTVRMTKNHTMTTIMIMALIVNGFTRMPK